MTWITAFLLTQLLEMPVFLYGMRRSALSVPMRLGVAFGASALTHPIVWFVLPLWLLPFGFPVFFALAETFAFVTEAVYLRAFDVEHPWRWALAANAFSATMGLVITALF